MFRRATLAVAAVVTAAAELAGVAGASPTQIIWQSGNNGPVAYAEAGWETRTPTSITDAFVLAAKTHRDAPGTTGPAGGAATHIFFELRTTYLDPSGQPTGGVDVAGNANGDVPFSIDSRNLTTASVNATVPVTRCILDASGDPTSCVDGGTLDVAASWTGQETMLRGSFYEDSSVLPGSFVLIDRASGTFRPASATATIGGEGFDASSLQFADMGDNTAMTVQICPHGSDATGSCN